MGQQQLMTSLVRGENMAPVDFVVTAVVTSTLALGLFAILTRLVTTRARGLRWLRVAVVSPAVLR